MTMQSWATWESTWTTSSCPASWKTSKREHLGPDPKCIPVLRFLGMSLKRFNKDRSQELDLLVGTISGNQLVYIVEVLTKFEPSLQLRSRRTPGNQESFATRNSLPTRSPTPEEQIAYLDALHELYLEDIVESGMVKDTWLCTTTLSPTRSTGHQSSSKHDHT